MVEAVLAMLTVDEAKEREPGIGCDAHGALLCRMSARVRNTRMLKALRRACESVGVKIVEDCPVTALAVDGETVRGVMANDRRFAAVRVVMTAGAWSSQLHPQLEEVGRVFPSKGQAVLLHMDNPPVRGIIKRKHWLCGFTS